MDSGPFPTVVVRGKCIGCGITLRSTGRRNTRQVVRCPKCETKQWHNYTSYNAARKNSVPIRSGVLRSGVHARAPRDADDFETVCEEWVRRCGVDARRTPKGPDGGIDIFGPALAAQCKFHPSAKVGAPDIQRLAGAAQQAGKRHLAFFHYGAGYTAAALVAARSLRVDLWAFDPDRMTFDRVS